MNFGSFRALLTISSSFSTYFTNNYVGLLLMTNLVLTISPIILEYHDHHMINAHFWKKSAAVFRFPSLSDVPYIAGAARHVAASRHWPAWNHAEDCHPEIQGASMGFFQVYPSRIATKKMENYRINYGFTIQTWELEGALFSDKPSCLRLGWEILHPWNYWYKPMLFVEEFPLRGIETTNSLAPALTPKEPPGSLRKAPLEPSVQASNPPIFFHGAQQTAALRLKMLFKTHLKSIQKPSFFTSIPARRAILCFSHTARWKWISPRYLAA